jgi:SET domain-containing protein
MEVQRTEKGRGIFATKDYRKGEVVEQAEVIIFPKKELPNDNVLAFYVFEWPGPYYALALGNGSLFNHSYEPNMIYLAYPKRAQMWFQALRRIKEGEELTINYNGDPKNNEIIEFLDPKRAKRARGGV